MSGGGEVRFIVLEDHGNVEVLLGLPGALKSKHLLYKPTGVVAILHGLPALVLDLFQLEFQQPEEHREGADNETQKIYTLGIYTSPCVLLKVPDERNVYRSISQ